MATGTHLTLVQGGAEPDVVIATGGSDVSAGVIELTFTEGLSLQTLEIKTLVDKILQALDRRPQDWQGV